MARLLKLKPVFKNNIWGGERMLTLFGYRPESLPLAEAWVFSCHRDGPCTVTGGEFDGKALPEAINILGKACLGSRGREFTRFPLLIKLIDAKTDLSVQVHPGDDYAARFEHDCGKTEMWYILNSEPGAFLYYGFKRKVSGSEAEESIKNGTLTDLLRKVYVKKGDCLFIRSGTVHAIGGGILLAEIQQSSNATYRMYDYGRVGADGKPRDLHIKKAMDVATLEPAHDEIKNIPESGTLASCRYFTSDIATVRGEKIFTVAEDTFKSYLCVEGSVALDDVPLAAGECVFAPAGSGVLHATGNGRVIESGV